METRQVIKIDVQELTRRRTELEMELEAKTNELLSVIYILDTFPQEQEVISLKKLKEQAGEPVEEKPRKRGRPKKTMSTKSMGRRSRFSAPVLAEKAEEESKIQKYRPFDELTRQEVLELNETVIFRYEADILGGYEDSRKRQFNSAKKLHQMEILKRIRLALVREWDKRRENNNL